jgi:hypothetical protein
MTFVQLEPSVQAPWTITTMGFVFVAFMILTLLALNSCRIRRVPRWINCP